MLALKIQNLTKTYGNQVQALKGVDLTVEEGDFFALLGPNGAGKTTLIGIISSLVNKTSGSIEIFGADLAQETEKAKSYLGLVPQDFNFSVFDKVLDVLVTQAGYYGIQRDQALLRAEKHLKQMALWEKRFDQVRGLSGGMKRRLMIARALMHEPKLLILDEPTAGVDITIRRSMWDYLRQINEQGTTIILTTHYLEEAERLCRNVAIIDRGEIIRHTGVQQLLSTMTSETFELFTRTPHSHPLQLAHFPVRKISDYCVEVDVAGEQTLNQLFAALSEANFQVNSMRNKANRLEELFLQLTEHDEQHERIDPN